MYSFPLSQVKLETACNPLKLLEFHSQYQEESKRSKGLRVAETTETKLINNLILIFLLLKKAKKVT